VELSASGAGARVRLPCGWKTERGVAFGTKWPSPAARQFCYTLWAMNRRVGDLVVTRRAGFSRQSQQGNIMPSSVAVSPAGRPGRALSGRSRWAHAILSRFSPRAVRQQPRLGGRADRRTERALNQHWSTGDGESAAERSDRVTPMGLVSGGHRTGTGVWSGMWPPACRTARSLRDLTRRPTPVWSRRA